MRANDAGLPGGDLSPAVVAPRVVAADLWHGREVRLVLRPTGIDVPGAPRAAMVPEWCGPDGAFRPLDGPLPGLSLADTLSYLCGLAHAAGVVEASVARPVLGG